MEKYRKYKGKNYYTIKMIIDDPSESFQVIRTDRLNIEKSDFFVEVEGKVTTSDYYKFNKAGTYSLTFTLKKEVETMAQLCYWTSYGSTLF